MRRAGHPAITAFAAIAPTVAPRLDGGTGPTSAPASLPVAATARSTSSSVGGTIGSPSLQCRDSAKVRNSITSPGASWTAGVVVLTISSGTESRA
jgi:hypothetical protein